jgi:L-fuculose-phosphate aldolase
VVLEALSTCVLIGNHGMIATGPDFREATWLAGELETLCKQYVLALQIGTPRVLAGEEIDNTIEKFKEYGLRRKPRAA